MKEYLLVFRDHERRWDAFSPAEMQAVIEEFDAWNQKIREVGGFIGAGKLVSELGSTVRGRAGSIVVDGPYCEAKEAISGFYCIRAPDQVSAVEAAKGFPMLAYGGSVEVRELALRQSE